MRYKFVCAQCAEPFIAKRRDAKYCSSLCRKHASLERKRTNNNLKRVIKPEVVNYSYDPPCMPDDIHILSAKIFGVFLSSEGTDLLGNLHIQKQCDVITTDFQNRFGCTTNEARSFYPEIEPPISWEENWAEYKKYYNQPYSK